MALLFLFWVFFIVVLTKAYWYPKEPYDGTTLQVEYIDTLTVKSSNSEGIAKPLLADLLKPFNPNTVSEAYLERIRLPKQVIRNWMKYIKSGGVFYKAESVKRLYGLEDSLYNQLKPFLLFEEKSFEKETRRYDAEEAVIAKKDEAININLADSMSFMRIKGIGPVFASRIIRYRNALGGFVSKQQLLEVYGMDSSSVQENSKLFELGAHSIRTININTVEFKTLLKHPYFSYKQVKAVVNYRKQHGVFQSKSDLLNIVVLDSIWFQKIEPYIAIE